MNNRRQQEAGNDHPEKDHRQGSPNDYCKSPIGFSFKLLNSINNWFSDLVLGYVMARKDHGSIDFFNNPVEARRNPK